MNTKQVIVIRRDLNMRRGKEMVQAAHVSMSCLTKHLQVYPNRTIGRVSPDFAKELSHWLSNSFKKIVVYVNSEQELEAIHQKALDKGLESHMITDSGLTEFHGVQTKTCIAIGPHWEEKFKDVTDNLQLY